MRTEFEEKNSSQEPVNSQRPISDFRSLDEYFDYCGIEKDYRPAYRQWVIAWLKLSDEEKLNYKFEQ